MLCRSRERGEDAVRRVLDQTSDAEVELMVCDLSSTRSIQDFLCEFHERHSSLDILFNNAAVMKPERTVTEDGFETMFQVNCLAAYILMTRLLDRLKNGSSPLIINVTAPADKYRLDFNDLQFEKEYSMYDSFFETKLCLLFAGLELARRPESEGVTVTMMVPGTFKSDFVRDKPVMGWFKNLLSARVEEAAGLSGRLAVLRALIGTYWADPKLIMKYAQRGLERLPRNDSVWRAIAAITLGDMHGFQGDMNTSAQVLAEAVDAFRSAGNPHFAMVANSKLVVTQRERGRLREALAACEEQIRVAEESGLGRSKMAGLVLTVQGEALAERNELDAARRCASEGVRLVEQGENLTVLSWAYLFYIRVLFSSGDLDGTESMVRKIHTLAANSVVPQWIEAQASAWQARVWLARKQLNLALRWAAEFDSDASVNLDYFSLVERITLARVQIAGGQLDDAMQNLQDLLKFAEECGRGARTIEVVMLRALALDIAGDNGRAIVTLVQALELAEPEGFVRIFVDEGPPMARLLYEVATRGCSQRYIHKLLSAFPPRDSEGARRPHVAAANEELFEPPTDREMDVLQCISEELTNEQIGERLFISTHTVKAHAKKINAKLQTRTRTEAVSKARGLGILPAA